MGIRGPFPYNRVMSAKKIIIYPNPKLRRKCEPITAVDETIREMFRTMADSLAAAEGIGLAAPQIGFGKRLVVISPPLNPNADTPLYLANPEIVAADGEQYGEEGCLSMPGLLVEIKRAATVTVEYLDYDNKVARVEGDGILAVCLQHEIDHLNGALILDKIPPSSRPSVLKKWQKSRS